MKKKKIVKQGSKSRFAGISLSMAVLGMMGLLLAFSDRSQPVIWVAFGFGVLGVLGINVVYLSVIARLAKAAKIKNKLKREKPEKTNKIKKKAGKSDKFKGPDGRNELRNLE